MIFKAWRPIENLSAGDKAARAIVYFVSMIYLFLGVSIVADRFMAAIEVITSKKTTQIEAILASLVIFM
jgi:solute carrier family 8 (sodium/calcium exchanger)